MITIPPEAMKPRIATIQQVTWRDRTPDLQPGGMMFEFVEPLPPERVRAALALVEQAQRLLGDAARTLCPVAGFAQEYKRVLKLHDQVRAGWDKISDRRARVRDAYTVCAWCNGRVRDDGTCCRRA